MLLVVPPLVLIVVLTVSAVAKVRDPRDTASVFRQLGLPPLLLQLRAPRLLPYAELALAAALLLARGEWYAVPASVALVLFALYFLVILRALRLPYPVTCGCFGRLGLGEVTGRTLGRNAVLLGLAVVTWVDSWRGHGVVQRLSRFDASSWLALAVVGVASVLVLAVIAVVAAVVAARRRVDPDDYRQVPTPDGVLHAGSGPVGVWQLSDEAARLLVFCDPARDAAVVERSGAWAARVAPLVKVHLVADRAAATPDGVLLDAEGRFRQLLGASSPGAVLLGTNRMIAGGPVAGLDEISALVDAMAEELRAAELP